DRFHVAPKRLGEGLQQILAIGPQYTNHGEATLLRARRDWPRRRAAEQRDELAPSHSITSSARPSSVIGTVRPSAFAVLRLIISSILAEGDLDAAFESLSQLRVGALVIGADPFFNSRSEQLAALALRYAVPAIYQYRRFAVAGGLMSYGGNIAESLRKVGVYVGRILKGENPADLPVQQFTSHAEHGFRARRYAPPPAHLSIEFRI